MRVAALGMTMGLLSTPVASRAQDAPPGGAILDAFDTLSGWSAAPSEGVTLAIRSDPGRHGRAMRLDFDFQGHGGYALARRTLDLDLPENYEFSFWIRGEALPNTLEFKLVDSTGDNVWWHTRPSFPFSRHWQRIGIKRRHIAFAWGPRGGGELRHAAALELVITAAQGGKGTVWIDDLGFRAREPERPYAGTPAVTASSGRTPAGAVDGDSATAWTAGPAPQWLALDFGREREFGGVVLDWAPRRYAADYALETSDDGTRWTPVYTVRGGNGGRDYLYLPESESRRLRLRVDRAAGGPGVALRGLAVEPVDWAAGPDDLWKAIAAGSPPGSYPRYFSGRQSFWTVIGASGDGRRGLLNEDGALETGAGRFSIEPFLATGGRLLTWNDVRRSQRLERGDLPIPSVEWAAGDLGLGVTAFAAGRAGRSSLLARYQVRNRGSTPLRVTLYLALRPFQVNPPWQFLTTPGGAAPIRRVAWDGWMVTADSQVVVPLTPPARFGATTLDRGDIVEHLRRDTLPRAAQASDSAGRASAALAYPLELAPGGARDIWLEVPLYGGVPSPGGGARAAAIYGESRLAATAREWAERLDQVGLRLPASAGDLVSTVKANLAYILINREGPAIEPGARSYRRSWIRDGAMISAALLRLGQADAVKAFLEWYAPYQYPNGKVPCCVDSRGADPVPENDSHGQLVYLAMEYYRHTGDRATLERMWPHALSAVGYIDSLRRARLTPVYQTAESLAFRGLLPQSISHEGYSAKPMHSYWDDFFALKGLKDAADMAVALGRQDDASRIGALRDEFRRDLYASIGRAMARHRIDYIPGSVELGDFDATSTTVALAPVDELAHLPAPAIERTFEHYWGGFIRRRDGGKSWEDYTPYELRTVGSMLRLGWKDRAHAALDWFLRFRRPLPWRQWAEVVWHDPATPKFIGDMPHTWVGSDFLRSVLDFFAYERESDDALIVGDGIVEGWVMEPPGVAVDRFGTHYGPLSYRMRGQGDSVEVRLETGVRVPPGGVVVRSPLARPIRAASVNGAMGEVREGREVVVRRLPATVMMRY